MRRTTLDALLQDLELLVSAFRSSLRHAPRALAEDGRITESEGVVPVG